MKDYQPPTSSPTSESLPRVQRIRNIPIERIPSPNNNINNISENNITATTTILPKKLNEEDRFRIHSNQVERKILPGAAFLPKIQQHHSNHRHHGIATTPTLSDHHNHHHHRRFDGYRENQQHPLNNHSQQQQKYYNLRTTPFGESLRHRTNTPGSYSISYEHQQHQPSAAAGISLVAQYGVGVGQDTGHSTASTPSASRPKLFPGNSNRGGSLPTSHSINLPNHSYNYRIQMPSRQSQHSSPIPPHPHQQQQHRHHSNHQHHIHDSDDILPEIEASGFPQDPIIEAERQEPDYHLVESGSDILLSTKDDVPAPAPTGPSTTNPTAKNKIFLETDIVDSSCDSDEDDDDVVKNCDIEDGGNTRGMNHDDDSVGTSCDEADEKEFQELVERELIVEKYERGPEGQEVDPWENPDFELYKVTDRYGFVHKSPEDIEADKRQKEKDRIKKELEREAKWLTMVDEWKARHPSKLPERIWKGVPEKLRSVIWQKLLGVEELKKGQKTNLYRELLIRARLVSPDIRQIDLDINRTYRDNLAFRRRYDVKQQSLFHVLAAYAMYNTEIGYCQGMSQIAGLFLMYMDEEDAFWALHSLMTSRRHAMHGMFAPGFPKLHRFQEHYEKILIKYLPKLKKHFDNEGVIPSYLTKWWFGCFLDRVPFPLALRIWDVFLYYGDSILIAMGYNIMRLHQKTLKKLSMEKCLDFIQSGLAKDFGYSFDDTMESLKKCLDKLQKDKTALPHPPAPDAIPEFPVKPLGPILARSMVDIRMDIAEIQSKGSRANSLHGKSPAPRRRKNVPSPLQTTKRGGSNRPPVAPSQQQQQSTSLGPSTATILPNGTVSPPPIGRVSPNSSEEKGPTTATNTNNNPQLNGPRKPMKPVIPDSDGFVPMSPRKATTTPNNRGSVYDNVPSASASNEPNVFGYGNHYRTSSNRSHNDSIRHSRETSADRIHRTPNNVTYVEIGEQEGGMPTIPAPDYDGADTNDRLFQVRNEKLLRTASAYQARRVHTNGGTSDKQPSLPPTGASGAFPSHSRPMGNSLKQRPSQQPGRYYFEADPPGVVPEAHEPPPTSPRQFSNNTNGGTRNNNGHKHSFV